MEQKESSTYDYDVLIIVIGAAATLDLDKLAEDAQRRLLIVGVAVLVAKVATTGIASGAAAGAAASHAANAATAVVHLVVQDGMRPIERSLVKLPAS